MPNNYEFKNLFTFIISCFISCSIPRLYTYNMYTIFFYIILCIYIILVHCFKIYF